MRHRNYKHSAHLHIRKCSYSSPLGVGTRDEPESCENRRCRGGWGWGGLGFGVIGVWGVGCGVGLGRSDAARQTVKIMIPFGVP